MYPTVPIITSIMNIASIAVSTIRSGRAMTSAMSAVTTVRKANGMIEIIKAVKKALMIHARQCFLISSASQPGRISKRAPKCQV